MDFARIAARERASLFVFPGGRPGSPGEPGSAEPGSREPGSLRGRIYGLANEGNLDGCIVWGSAAGSGRPGEGFRALCAGLGRLPLVAAGFRAPGHPCVGFGERGGMRDLVAHCIRRHGARKIAFLRGPASSGAAQERFEGYLDALAQAGLSGPGEAPLASDPLGWGSGALAAERLFRGRSLVPGRDFDTLACASDRMALDAAGYLARQGYRVPGDYRAIGFGDSGEGRAADCPLSTVRLPGEKMAEEAFAMLLRLMSGRGAVKDAFFGAEAVIRESCGCPGGFSEMAQGPPPGGGTGGEGEREGLKRLAAARLRPASAAACMGPAIDALFRETTGAFVAAFGDALRGFFESGGDEEGLAAFVCEAARGNGPGAAKARRAEAALYRAMLVERSRLSARDALERGRLGRALGLLRRDLLQAPDRFSVAQALASRLPGMGIGAAALALRESGESSVFVGGFSAGGACAIGGQRFSARLLVPEGFRGFLGEGAFMAQPLFSGGRPLGHIVHSFSSGDGAAFEDLRLSVSCGLRAALLAEEAARSRRAAARSDRAKAEFLRVLDGAPCASGAFSGACASAGAGEGGGGAPAPIESAAPFEPAAPIEPAAPFGAAAQIVPAGQGPAKRGVILFVGPRDYWEERMAQFAPAGVGEAGPGLAVIGSMQSFGEALGGAAPLLIVIDGLDPGAAAAARRHPLAASAPILMVCDRVDSPGAVAELAAHPRLIVCHRAALSSPDFLRRAREIAGGAGILPRHTGILVKKAILYFDLNAGSCVSRMKLAGAVNSSEDYLSRVFHREMGLSLWDYLNRLRVSIAADLLLQTGDSVSAIAQRAGFHDQSYFCRIFKRLRGVPPGRFRRS